MKTDLGKERERVRGENRPRKREGKSEWLKVENGHNTSKWTENANHFHFVHSTW